MRALPSFSVSHTARDGPFAQRYPALAALPFILDSKLAYHRLGNAFLIDRGLGLWHPQSKFASASCSRPTPRSMQSYAEWLANFLEWTDLRGIDVRSCDYFTHVAGQYQREMLAGTWSRSGSPLAPSTVNLRVQQACDYLAWLGDRGLRPQFHVQYREHRMRFGSATHATPHVAASVKVRQGKAKQVQRSLQMPTNPQVTDWLARIYRRHGTTVGLMCETVLQTAVRREELVALHSDVLADDPKAWHISNPVAPPAEQMARITIRHGTKGPCYGFTEQGDKLGPVREILIPLTLATKWHEYRRTIRNSAFAKWVAGTQGAARRARAKQCVHLFLREASGARFTGPAFYHAWTSESIEPCGWSPHDGRHWWACSVLWRELSAQKEFARVENESSVALIDATALGIIRLQIQPQLGHASEATTMLYLRWVRDMLAVPLMLDDSDMQVELLPGSKGET